MKDKPPSDRLIINYIDSCTDPTAASFRHLTTEEKIRYALEHYSDHEKEKAKQRQRDGGKLKKPGGEGDTGKSGDFVARRIGMKTTNYESAKRVVTLADELKKEGYGEEADHLLCILNDRSIRAAVIECDRLLDSFSDICERLAPKRKAKKKAKRKTRRKRKTGRV